MLNEQRVLIAAVHFAHDASADDIRGHLLHFSDIRGEAPMATSTAPGSPAIKKPQPVEVVHSVDPVASSSVQHEPSCGSPISLDEARTSRPAVECTGTGTGPATQAAPSDIAKDSQALTPPLSGNAAGDTPIAGLVAALAQQDLDTHVVVDSSASSASIAILDGSVQPGSVVSSV